MLRLLIHRFANQLFVDGVWRRCTQRLYGLLTICYTLHVNMPYAREHYIIYAVGEDYLEGKCIEKRFLFFEHKGTRIFETTKPLIKKKLHILCFLNYQPFFDEQNRRFPTQVLFEHCM